MVPVRAREVSGGLVQPGDRTHQVDLHGLPVLLEAVLRLAQGRHHAGRVDHEVEASQVVHDARKERLDLRGTGDVVHVGSGERRRGAGGSRAIDRVGDGGELGLASGEEGDAAARSRQLSREGGADAGGCAEDDRLRPGWP